jgi:transcriptional regulator with XRE-family HTH domain
VENPVSLRTYFGKQVRDMRKGERWSQSELAKRLRDKGFSAAHPSTIAKIEAGDRPTNLDELAAFAAVFNVGTDLLLGQPSGEPTFRVVRRLTQTAQMGRWQAEAVESEIRQALAGLAASDELAWLVAEGERAADALAAASTALAAVGSGFAGGAVSKGTDAMLRALLKQEIEDEDNDA